MYDEKAPEPARLCDLAVWDETASSSKAVETQGSMFLTILSSGSNFINECKVDSDCFGWTALTRNLVSDKVAAAAII